MTTSHAVRERGDEGDVVDIVGVFLAVYHL